MRITSIKKIAAHLRILKEQHRSCILFLGAGASKSAGIPLAGELADILIEDSPYKDLLCDCDVKDYPSLMAELTPNSRKTFLREYINNAKLNQTHLYAAALMKAGYIDTVVTVNFDPLMLQALSVLNIFPSVYDMAISREFIIGGIEYPAVVYLHGQSHGFWQLNTQDEMPMALENIRNLFSDITSSRSMIVVGYSGSDPVFNELAKIAKFEHGIFWVGYKDVEPLMKVKEELLDKHNKSPWLLGGFNSDEFFRELKNELKVPEPNIINKPFSHLKETVQIINDFEIDSLKLPWTSNTLKWINTAIEGFELGKGFQAIASASTDSIRIDNLIEKLKEIINEGTYNDVLGIEEVILQSNNGDAIRYLAYIYYSWALKLSKLAKKGEAEILFQEVFQKYQKALKIKPDMHEAFLGWGDALVALAKIKQEITLFEEAFEKYSQSSEIEPNGYVIYLNWANALTEAAKLLNNDENLFNEAFKKYNSALIIKPDLFEGFVDWGNSLFDFAKSKGTKIEIFEEAFEKMYSAGKIKATNPVINQMAVIVSNLYLLKAPSTLEFAEKAVNYFLDAVNKKSLEQEYNIACMYSILQQKDKFLHHFEKSLINEANFLDHINTDTDLDNYRALPEFQSLIKKYRVA